MRLFLYTVAAFCLVKSYSQNKPNVIIIITDDQGYQDLGCYGSPLIKTPAIDKMAKEGLRLTSYYVSSSVSSASRAGLMTGKFNNKNGITGVLWPGDEGLSTDEKTIAEYLKEAGYKECQIVVERNCEIVSKKDYTEIKIEEEDTIEVLSFVGGG